MVRLARKLFAHLRHQQPGHGHDEATVLCQGMKRSGGSSLTGCCQRISTSPTAPLAVLPVHHGLQMGMNSCWDSARFSSWAGEVERPISQKTATPSSRLSRG